MSAVGKVFKTIFVLLGLAGIATSAAFIIKSPESFIDLGRNIGIVNDNVDEATTQKLPYLMDFTSVTGTGSGYKSSYFNAKNSVKKWYCSWGTEASKTKDGVNVSYVLGWNNIDKVYYGGYTYKNEIQSVINDSLIEDNYKFTYLLMDFDFYENHQIEFNVKAFDDLSQNTKLCLISSNNKGKTWSITKEQNLEEAKKGKTLTIDNRFEASGTINKRYGLLLISKLAYSRLEINSFIALGI